jgi:hypothetical protein
MNQPATVDPRPHDARSTSTKPDYLRTGGRSDLGTRL